MKNFILDKKPTMNEAELTIENTKYQLRMVKNNGCYLSIYEHDILKDEIALTRTDMKALFLLLSTE